MNFEKKKQTILFIHVHFWSNISLYLYSIDVNWSICFKSNFLKNKFSLFISTECLCIQVVLVILTVAVTDIMAK